VNLHPSAVGPPADRRAGRFPLEVAEKIAAALLEKLAPHAERMQVAGSIRRRRPDVGDIDLVAIPKLEQVKTGLFTTETQRPRDSQLAVEFCALTGKLMARGDCIIRGQLVRNSTAMPATSALPDGTIGVDLYLCTPDTWATTLLIRTGSAEHNIWLCSRARELGGKLHADGSGLELPGQYDPQLQRTVNMRRVVPGCEAEIFLELMAAVRTAKPNWTDEHGVGPELREVVNGRPLWLRKDVA